MNNIQFPIEKNFSMQRTDFVCGQYGQIRIKTNSRRDHHHDSHYCILAGHSCSRCSECARESAKGGASVVEAGMKIEVCWSLRPVHEFEGPVESSRDE